MLRALSIQNFALIEKTKLEFNPGFHVITGETGSGKSILLGALNQILGERADLSLVRDPEKKTVVEAVFELSANLKPWFQENDIDFEQESIIRREFSVQGKSRAFVNDTPVQLSQLKELTEQLVYIHSQHETLALRKSSFQFELLDAFGDLMILTDQVKQYALDIKDFQRKIEVIEQQTLAFQKEKDYLQFQVDELEKLELASIQYAELEIEFARLAQVDDLKEVYQAFSSGIEDDVMGPLPKLAQLKALSDKLKNGDPILTDWATRLQSIILDLKDISHEAERVLSNLEPDPERVFWLTEKLNLYNTILRKHGLSTQQELQDLQASMMESLESSLHADENLERLRMELDQLLKAYANASNELFEKRLVVIPQLENHLLSVLYQLKLEHAALKITLVRHERVDTWGGMEIAILFSANKGLEFKPIEKAASGGELSRVMLAIQATMSKKRNLPTLILDEIDTGVSGDVASRIGKLLQEMGDNLQLIAITHLPQVAAKGTTHFEVKKSHDEAVTLTAINRLSAQERIDAIAGLLAGSVITDAARNSARELMSL